MNNLSVNSDERMEAKFLSYPENVRKKLLSLRELILEVAQESEKIEAIEETLKWGEPSYLSKHGSTIRINQLKKLPNTYAIYFKCTSKLVPTFKQVFGDTFNYEKNRAILFGMDDKLPKKELKKCIELALNYHKVKHLVLLGM